MEHLFEKLAANGASDIYPYHMPGHKRNIYGNMPAEIFRADITEIDGFDNLHAPEEILLDLKNRAAALYGAEESFYLVNGSSCGILAAISAALPFGGKLLMARNCHKSAYHAVYLRHLETVYCYPDVVESFDFPEALTPEKVGQALEADPGIQAVLIVSPTYEGRLADVRGIAEVVHKKGIPLIVDEAHGAHLGLGEGVAPSSVTQGADLIVQSVHKTLPGMTQTALLHVCGSLINREVLKRFLKIYQTTSPSYILMASIDNALTFVEEQGGSAYRQFVDSFETMCRELQACEHLRFPGADREKQDIGKLFISVKNTNMNGRELFRLLLEKYHLQLEMASETGALAMFTIGDRPEGYERIKAALLEIDGTLADRDCDCDWAREEGVQEQPESVLLLWEAWDRETESIPLAESAGRLAGEFVNFYPPGVPILVPGERITEKATEQILRAAKEGLTVQGTASESGERTIVVLTEG